MKSINPFTNTEIAEYTEFSALEVTTTIAKVANAQEQWRQLSVVERAQHLKSLSECLLAKLEENALLITTEMGKLIKQARAEITKCATLCDFYADKGEEFLRDSIVKTESPHSFVTYQPLGVILGVMPWNFPFWQVFRFAVPTLLAGNGAVLKHASNVTGCALAIEKLFIEAKFPENIFRTLPIGSSKVAAVIANDAIKAVSLTGSTGAGRSVAALAGQHLKKTVLELGGSDPYIVLDDADVALAVEQCVMSRLNNAGQSCIAAKRFIVCNGIYNKFLGLFTEKMQQQVMGDPLAPTTTLAPMVSVAARDEIHKQVQSAIAEGAKCILGGNIPDLPGAFYPPTILLDPTQGSTAYREELFGPVATIIKATSQEDAIRIANDTNFGLGGAIFTRNTELGLHLARNVINSGSVYVNKLVASDPRMPFGGIKDSGFGRELASFGIQEFVNVKAICLG